MITPRPYAIVLDDHPLVGRSLAQYLRFTFNDLPVSQATSWSDVLHLQATLGCPQLLVADVWLADGHHLNAMQRWCGECPGVLWLAISGDDDPSVAKRVRAAGARALCPKKHRRKPLALRC
jgi:DNA-binding NarL/FixJ family response regulator